MVGSENGTQTIANYADRLQMFTITGDQVNSFLQGYLTCDCEALRAEPSNQLMRMALCNLKGRVVCSGWAAQLSETKIGLVVHESLVGTVAAQLAPYARFHRCEIDTENALDLFAVKADQVNLNSSNSFRTQDNRIALAANSEGLAGDDLAIANYLLSEGFVVVTEESSAQFLPQMLNLGQTGAVDFNKGCYLGQEIVARAEHRGQVKRKLVQFSTEETTVTLGEPWADTDCVVYWDANSRRGMAVARS